MLNRIGNNQSASKKWISTYIPVIRQMLQQASNKQALGMLSTDTTKGPSSNQLKQLEYAMHLGVPTELRKVVWSLIIPNTLKIN